MLDTTGQAGLGGHLGGRNAWNRGKQEAWTRVRRLCKFGLPSGCPGGMNWIPSVGHG